MKEELLRGLTAEQIAKAKACKNSDELLLLAKAEGIELSEEQLNAVTGGCLTQTFDDIKCPKCGGYRVAPYHGTKKICQDCHCTFVYWGPDNYTDVSD